MARVKVPLSPDGGAVDRKVAPLEPGYWLIPTTLMIHESQP